MNAKLEFLKELGLSDGQIEVYSAILELGISSLNGIHEKTGIERRNIYDILNKLMERGLVTYTTERGKRTYQCTHPNKIIEEIKIRQNALKELEDEIPNLANLFSISRPKIWAEVFRGNDSIKALLNEMLQYKESFWMGGNNMEHAQATTNDMQQYFLHWMDRRAEKKHMMHDLISKGGQLKGWEPNKVQKHKKGYYRLCNLPKDFYTPLVIVIFGNKVAQIVWSKQPFAFVIESEKVKESFMKYFNYFWREPR